MKRLDRPRLFHKNPAAKDAIAMTFDDGPCVTATPDILGLLKEHAVVATFFMIGERVRRHPDLARRVFDEGHQIADHSDRHLVFRSLAPSVCKKEIEKAEETFRSVMGVRPRFYRPPKGLINRYVSQALSGAGYYVATWSRMPGDYFWWHTAAWIANRLSKVRPGDIVVLHDGLSLRPEPDRRRTLSILPEFIRGMKKQGIRFVSIAELVGLPPYFEEAAQGPDGAFGACGSHSFASKGGHGV
jgi:peptidoglycan/xylan/chitin deacetylase (PgdA/CDA1 family)